MPKRIEGSIVNETKLTRNAHQHPLKNPQMGYSANAPQLQLSVSGLTSGGGGGAGVGCGITTAGRAEGKKASIWFQLMGYCPAIMMVSPRVMGTARWRMLTLLMSVPLLLLSRNMSCWPS